VSTRAKKLEDQVERRRRRLELTGKDQIVAATDRLTSVIGKPAPLKVRTGFVYRPNDPAAVDYSDRKAPPAAERPPATRLVSPRGSALRLELIALAVAQRRKAGSEFINDLPLAPGYADDDGSPAWVELITTPAQYASAGRFRATPLTKRRRSLTDALDALKEAGLVDYPRAGDARGRREGFLLMDERVMSPTGGLTYRVPTSKEPTVTVPQGFLHEGWLHVLEDSEIALLLMVRCGLGKLPDSEGWVAIPAGERLLNYGLSRDAFSAAHPILREMGLLEVQSVGRHSDGRVIDFRSEGPSLHRLKLVPEGFEEPAYDVALESLDRLSDT
jgi:DNA-binding transcriptional ArsR family regulator